METRRSGRQSDISAAIESALRRLGGEGSIAEITAEVQATHPGRWKDISVALADLTRPGSPSSQYPAEQRILERVGRGRYRLRG